MTGSSSSDGYNYDSTTIKYVQGEPGPLGNTQPAGPNTPVTVSLISGISITFSEVTGAGNTTATQTTPPQGPPSGFRFRGYAYDITTTATYSSPVTVTISYDEAEVLGNESNLKLFHWTGSSWEDCTISVDTVNNTITGQVTSLSPFVVGEEAVATGYNTPWLVATAFGLMFAGFWLLRKRVVV